MENGIKYLQAMSDPAFLELLGSFVQQTRLQQNKTQHQVALAAGVNRSTIVQVEKGGGWYIAFIYSDIKSVGAASFVPKF